MNTAVTFLMCLCLSGLFQDAVPYKPKDEYQLDIKFDLRQKPLADRSTINFDETIADQNKHSSAMLPYLIVNVKFLKFKPEEVRVKAFKSDGTLLINKKAKEGLLLEIDLGYTDDVKDHVTANEYRIFTYSEEKKELFLIHMKVENDGTFKVNGEANGKF